MSMVEAEQPPTVKSKENRTVNRKLQRTREEGTPSFETIPESPSWLGVPVTAPVEPGPAIRDFEVAHRRRK